MQDFLQQIIILGQLPGTNIQITFVAWLFGVGAGLVFTFLWMERRWLRYKNLIITTALLVRTHRRLQA